MIRNILILIVCLFISHRIFAGEIELFCEKSRLSCFIKVEQSLRQMGCNVDKDTVVCEDYDNKKDYCVAHTELCTEPSPGLFGGTECFNGIKKDFAPYSKTLSLTWWMGLFGDYLTHICVEK